MKMAGDGPGKSGRTPRNLVKIRFFRGRGACIVSPAGQTRLWPAYFFHVTCPGEYDNI